MARYFGPMLKNLRKRLDLSQQELVDEIRGKIYARKYHKSDISKWEHGTTKPPEEVVEYLEEILLPHPDGSLLKAAGYLESAELRARRSRDFERLAHQQAQVRHFDDLCRLIEQWREQLGVRVYDPYPDFVCLFPKDFKPMDAELGYHHKGSLLWEVTRDGTVEVHFAVEDEFLFRYLECHLPYEQMWEDFRSLKQELAEAIKRASSSPRSRAEGVVALVDQIADELDKALARRTFLGSCEVCPIVEPAELADED